ncbi:ABC transporter permease [Verrucomicrobiales bacterium]|nr:ABC transporter permease [Verrucomicrobiales bacterium]
MREFFLLIQETGVGAVFIVGLVAVLTGLILAFVGSVQLKQFGAEIYVADLVGVSMFREMGSLMTAIIMAGRSGAAFAAHIGSMKANEEIDALTTLGIEPHGYLVLPRVIALTLMMPLLSLYAAFLGVIGGGVISNATLGISWSQYIVEMQTIVNMTEIGIGVGKSVVFAILVAMSGCFSGMRSGTDAAAVGRATTDAVVNAIVLIVIADSIFAVVFSLLGI